MRSASSGSTPRSAGGGKTDTPLPIGKPVADSAGATRTTPRGGDRIISGIDLVDYGAGGLMPNHVYLIKGGGGVGKSILGLQFLTRGLEHQEPGILITDQKPENVITQATAIGFKIEDAVRRNQLSILNPSGRYFDLVESPADVMAIVEELGDYIKRIGAKRVVIDPIYTLINTQYSSHFALTLTQSLMNALEDLPATVILVGSDDDNAELNPIMSMLEQNAFGVLHLSQDAATGGRMMRIQKLRYASSEELSAHYRILNGRGLINYRGEGEKVSDVTKPWEEPAEANRSVLLIGAQTDAIRKVKDALGDKYNVQAEADLQAGVSRVKREHPGLVLVTPQRSAGAISAILDLAQNSASSVAFLSPAANRQSDRVLYLRAGADDYFTEPFTPGEFRARVDALIRRSGRRLTIRDTGVNAITADEMSSLMNAGDTAGQHRGGPVLTASNNNVQYDPEFNDRLQRNIDTVSKLDTPFAVYWIKADADDRELNSSLAKLCRQEDILCHNKNGEFVAILTGTDANGVKGFENRLSEKLGDRLSRTQRGHQLYSPGQTA
ncbi:MAG TPA: ATPase domain-containing protein [Thermoanaerobaculia bacterium]|nr:ATPase domain-containing protein [Thermoanaerobaculia bacterium]